MHNRNTTPLFVNIWIINNFESWNCFGLGNPSSVVSQSINALFWVWYVLALSKWASKWRRKSWKWFLHFPCLPFLRFQPQTFVRKFSMKTISMSRRSISGQSYKNMLWLELQSCGNQMARKIVNLCMTLKPFTSIVECLISEWGKRLATKLPWYDSRVINYDCRMFSISLITGLDSNDGFSHSNSSQTWYLLQRQAFHLMAQCTSCP